MERSVRDSPRELKTKALFSKFGQLSSILRPITPVISLSLENIL